MSGRSERLASAAQAVWAGETITSAADRFKLAQRSVSALLRVQGWEPASVGRPLSIDTASARAARMVLEEGLSRGEAGRRCGITVQSVSVAVMRRRTK